MASPRETLAGDEVVVGHIKATEGTVPKDESLDAILAGAKQVITRKLTLAPEKNDEPVPVTPRSDPNRTLLKKMADALGVKEPQERGQLREKVAAAVNGVLSEGETGLFMGTLFEGATFEELAVREGIEPGVLAVRRTRLAKKIIARLKESAASTQQQPPPPPSVRKNAFVELPPQSVSTPPTKGFEKVLRAGRCSIKIQAPEALSTVAEKIGSEISGFVEKDPSLRQTNGSREILVKIDKLPITQPTKHEYTVSSNIAGFVRRFPHRVEGWSVTIGNITHQPATRISIQLVQLS